MFRYWQQAQVDRDAQAAKPQRLLFWARDVLCAKSLLRICEKGQELWYALPVCLVLPTQFQISYYFHSPMCVYIFVYLCLFGFLFLIRIPFNPWIYKTCLKINIMFILSYYKYAFFQIGECFANRIITSILSLLSNSILCRRLSSLNKVFSYMYLQKAVLELSS